MKFFYFCKKIVVKIITAFFDCIMYFSTKYKFFRWLKNTTLFLLKKIFNKPLTLLLLKYQRHKDFLHQEEFQKNHWYQEELKKKQLYQEEFEKLDVVHGDYMRNVIAHMKNSALLKKMNDTL